MTYHYTPLFPLAKDQTRYRKLTGEGVRAETLGGREFLIVSREAIRLLAEEAMIDINHLLRPSHLAQLAKILDDPEATANDRFVAYDLLKNANIAAGGVLPMCQDTGTAIVMGKKGRLVLTDGDDESALAEGIRDAYEKKNLRYSQLAPLGMFEEKNTATNLPAQIEIYAEGEDVLQIPVRRQGRRLGQQDLPLPGGAVAADARPPARLPQGEDPDARHGGLPALSPGDRHRRHVGGIEPQDSEARLDPLSRRPADPRAARTRMPSAISRWRRKCTR